MEFVAVIKVLLCIFISCAASMALIYMADDAAHDEYVDQLERDHALAEAIRKLRNVEVSR